MDLLLEKLAGFETEVEIASVVVLRESVELRFVFMISLCHHAVTRARRSIHCHRHSRRHPPLQGAFLVYTISSWPRSPLVVFDQKSIRDQVLSYTSKRHLGGGRGWGVEKGSRARLRQFQILPNRMF